uniref:DUF1018 domain-containing protein n=1 Tax=viral metagenome TaxID=1070528 RepID=A0A6M3KPX4_9ZZZZ
MVSRKHRASPCGLRPDKRNRSASEIYNLQNKVLHKIFEQIGFPYNKEKAYLCAVFTGMFGRKVTGLSDMTLVERRQAISHFAPSTKGYRVNNPGVPREFREWKKGDDEKCFEMIPAEDRQLRMAYALLLELGQTPDKMPVIVRARYGIDHERWIQPKQLNDLINYLLYRVQNCRR